MFCNYWLSFPLGKMGAAEILLRPISSSQNFVAFDARDRLDEMRQRPKRNGKSLACRSRIAQALSSHVSFSTFRGNQHYNFH